MSEQSAQIDDTQMDAPRFRDAYEQYKDEIDAVPDEEILTPNVEITAAVTTVLGAGPKIRKMRPLFLLHLPTFPIDRFDKCESFALALGHAQTAHLAASAPAESIPGLVTESQTTREALLVNIQVAVHYGLIDGTRLRELRGTNGHRHTAFDLLLLSQLLRENWPKIEGKTMLKADDLKRAEQLAARLATAVGVREQTSTASTESAKKRDKAFTLFIKTYNRVRRAVIYLDEDNGEEIAPTLYIGRGPGKKRAEQDAAESPAPQLLPAKPDGVSVVRPEVAASHSDSPYSP